MRKTFFLLFLISLSACSTAPVAKKLRFETSWVRSALKDENYGYRHSERTAPLFDGDTVYQGNAVDGVVALSSDNGRVKWRFDVRNGVESGLSQDDKAIYFGASDGNFYALNKITGKIIWTFPTRVENLGPSILNKGIVYFISGNNVLYALDCKTGKQIWNYNRGEVSSLSIRGASRPTVYKNSIYAGFSDGYLVALNLNEGAMQWERKLSTNLKFVDVDASPVIDENNIWVSSYDGALYSLSRVDGQVQWRMDDGGAVPVTIEGDVLYFPTLSRNIYALNKKTGKEIWKFSYEEKLGVPSQILIIKGVVLFGTSDGALFALSETNGNTISSFWPGNGINAAPVLGSESSNIYVYSNQANLYKLRLDWYNPQKDKLQWKN